MTGLLFSILLLSGLQPGDEQPAAEPSFAFTYYGDGAVASRTDAKGNRFDYRYDELGRLVEVGFLSQSAYVTEGDTEGTVAFEYTPDGKPTLATVYDAAGTTVLYQNRFDYDDRGNLIAEYQSHIGEVDGSTPLVGYDWEYSPADETHGNFDRLLSLTYPARPEATGPRELTFHYGSAPGTIDGYLSRVTAIDDSELGAGLATYTHMGGGSRRVIAGFVNGVQAAEMEQGDYAWAYDRFGRLRDLDFRDAADDIIQRYRYGYDLAGTSMTRLRAGRRRWSPGRMGAARGARASTSRTATGASWSGRGGTRLTRWSTATTTTVGGSR